MTSIYAIQALDGGPVKIGQSGNPDQRLLQLQGAHHEELAVVRLFAGDDLDERRIHNMASEYHVRGEWYRDEPGLWEVFEAVRCAAVIRDTCEGLAARVADYLGAAIRTGMSEVGDGRVSAAEQTLIRAGFSEACEATLAAMDELIAVVLADNGIVKAGA